LFAALSGHHVHEAPTVNEQLLAAMTVPARPIQELVPDVAEPVAALTDRALAFSKEGRWPNARAMQEAVRAAYEAIAGRPLEQAPRLSIRPPPTASVNQNDATIDAAATEAALQRATTARPVTTPPGSSGGRRTLGIVFAAFAVGTAGYVFGQDRDANETVPRATGATTPTVVEEPAREKVNAPLQSAAVDISSPSPSTAPSPSALKSDIGAKQRKAVRGAAPPAPASSRKTSPPPAETPKAQDTSVDLFSRRK
jgi:serine/threonine-protein kinase